MQTNGVRFCISYPRRTMPQILYAKQAVDDGLLGRVTAVRVRIAHDGAVRDWLPAHFYDPKACGGGAMMDLGAHGMYLCRWLLGPPKRIVSVFNTVTGRAVDDNTVSVIEFENGAIAVNETSFTGFGGPIRWRSTVPKAAIACPRPAKAPRFGPNTWRAMAGSVQGISPPRTRNDFARTFDRC